MRRHAVAKRLEIAVEQVGALAGRFERREIVAIAVQSLPAGGELESAEEEVEAPGRTRADPDPGACRTGASPSERRPSRSDSVACSSKKSAIALIRSVTWCMSVPLKCCSGGDGPDDAVFGPYRLLTL